MKKTGLVGLTGMVMLVSGLVGLAQGPNQHVFTMKTSFYAGDAKLPAGTYTLRPVQGENPAYTLENKAGTHSVIVETRPSSQTTKGKGEVVLNRYAGVDYLEGVETSN